MLETVGKTLERVRLKVDHILGNTFLDPNVFKKKGEKILCRRNNVGYRIPCILFSPAHLGETGENMHTRATSYV